MPNWKSYDSSVRLLSAILAAHPELKLNYGEIAACFGDNVTKSAMEFRFRRIKTDATAIRDARANGIDPFTLDMDGGVCKEICRRFGGDCTVSALENRFRRIKGDAKALNDALARGIDPITIPTDSLNGKIGKEIAKYYGDCTVSSLDHRFRPIKRDAQAMREAMRDAIADKYGEDTTAKAVSTRFERLKKEPAFNLANSTADANGTGASNGGPKPKATPRKRKNAGVAGNSNEDDEDEFEEKKFTPKKPMLNKTQGGRVSKLETPRKKVNGSSSGPIPLDISDDEGAIIKPEPTGNGFNHSNGNGNSFTMVDAEEEGGSFYEPGYASEGDMV